MAVKQVWMDEVRDAHQHDADVWDDGGIYSAKKKKRRYIEDGGYTDLGF